MRLYGLESLGVSREDEQAGKYGTLKSEQGGYVYGQVRLAQVCDLVSRRKGLESSGHQLGVGSEASPVL